MDRGQRPQFRQEVPGQKLLDPLTRIDELLVQNTAVLNELLGFLRRQAITPTQPEGVTLQPMPQQQQLVSGMLDYCDEPRSFSMTTALVDEPITIDGDLLFAKTDADSLDGVGVRLDRQDAPLIYFNDSPVIGAPGQKFYKLFLTSPAASGKTLKLFVCRGSVLHPLITSTKPALAKNQKKWSLLVTYRQADGDPIAGNSVASVAAYTVPAGWRLHIGGAVISCNASCIQKVVMTHTPGIIGDYRYDVKGELVFGPLSSTLLDPGDILTIYTYNNDTVYRDFSITVVGVLEAVEV